MRFGWSGFRKYVQAMGIFGVPSGPVEVLKNVLGVQETVEV